MWPLPSHHFDTEIIIQLLIARMTIKELPIPTYYGNEICHVNGFAYAANVVKAALKARLQEMCLSYDPAFDCAPAGTYSPYTPKFGYSSTHTAAMERILPNSRVLDLGCAGGYLGARLRSHKKCFVTGMDIDPVRPGLLDEFIPCDLNARAPSFDALSYDTVLLLDVIEHLRKPEIFLEELRRIMAWNPALELFISTGNIACFAIRAMLLLGQFNYGPRGILDLTHTRLFTFASLRRALRQAGFDVLETKGIPPPYPLAAGNNFFSRILLAVNGFLIALWRGLFSYQIFMRVKAQPSLELLLATAEAQSHIRAAAIKSADPIRVL